MGTELDDLYVTLSTREAGFVSGLSKATDASKTAERAMAQIGTDASKSFSGVDSAAAKTFEGIKRDANGKLRDASGKFVQMGSDAEKAFLQAERASDRAGQRFGGLRSIGDKVRDGFDGVKEKFRSTGDEGESSGSRVGSAWGRIGGVIAGLGVAAAGVSFFKGALDEAREAVKVGADTANSLKVTGASAWISAKQVGSLADSLSNYAGIDDEAVQAGENLLLTFKNVKNAGTGVNAVFDRGARAAVDLSSKFGGDLSAASIQVGKALDNPIKGVAALGRVGVTFTDQQKAMIKTLVESGDTLGAQKIILAELESQVGGTAGAMADPWQRLGVVWANVKEQVGTALLPVLNKVLTWGATLLPKALDVATRAFGFVAGGVKDFISGFKQGTDAIGSAQSKWAQWGAVVFGVFERVKGIVSAFLYTLRTGFTEDEGTPIERFALKVRAAFFAARDAVMRAWDSISPVLHSIGDYIAEHLQPILTAVGAAFAVLAGAGAIGLVAGAIGGLVAVVGGLVAALATPVVAVAALVAALVYAYEQSATFRDVVAEIVGFFQAHPDLGLGLATGGLSVVVTHWAQVRSAIETTVAWIRENVVPVVQRVVGYVVEQFGHLVQWTQENWPKIHEAIGHVLKVIEIAVAVFAAPFIFVWQNAHDQIMSIVKTVWSAIQALIESVMTIVMNVIELVLNVINGDWGAAWDNIKNILGAVWDVIVNLVSTAINVVWQVLQGALGIIAGLWSGAWDGIKFVLAWAWGAIVSGVSTGITSVIDFFIGLPGRVLGALAGIGGWLFWQGIALLQGMINGIVNMAVHLLISVTDSIWGAVLGAGRMAGDLWQAGVNLLQGMINGVVSMAKHLVIAVTDSISGAINAGKSLLGLRSPSRVFFEMGQLTGKGMELGLIDSADGVRRAMSKLVAIPNGGAMSVSVAPFAAQNTVRQDITVRHQVVVVHEGEMKLTGTPQDHEDLARKIARPLRKELIGIAPSVGGSLWGTAR